NIELHNYYSIQEDFPLVYGVGKRFITANTQKDTSAEAKQLSAYLLFYDQILANITAQIVNLGNSFSNSALLKEPASTTNLSIRISVLSTHELLNSIFRSGIMRCRYIVLIRSCNSYVLSFELKVISIYCSFIL
ncbi:unnamed protein product, partial [marine sediment metagenome]